jgi:DNA replication protein DnaC
MLSERDKKKLLRLKEQIILACPKCKGTAIGCSCLDIFRVEFRKVKSNLPAKYRSAKVEDITHPQILEARKILQDYVTKIADHKASGMGLVLYGSPGLAKTHLASAVLNEAFKYGYTGYFTTLDRCVNEYASGWKDLDLKMEFTGSVLEKDFLVLDEVGNESRTNVALVRGCLNDILRHRSNSLLPTIITSNLAFEKFASAYGDEIYSLLHESSIPVPFEGIDFRKGMANV